MVFVNSMSDLFQEGVPTSYIKAVTKVMSEAPWHIYQVLTKRSQRMRDLLRLELNCVSQKQHIWWGVSVENRKVGLPRLEDLKNTPVAIRFLSVEPLLEDLGEIDLTGIHWVIVGGESGHGARPMKETWVTSVLEQCKSANVPFFFKQWGGVNKKHAGRLLNGRTYDEFPQVLRAPLPPRISRDHLARIISHELAVDRSSSSELAHLV
jgi:protein gp37